jgi:translation initiation factor IF-1
VSEAPVTNGIVTEGTGGIWRIRRDDGTETDASLAGRLKQEMKGHLKLAVGDHVTIEADERDSGWRITAIGAAGRRPRAP